MNHFVRRIMRSHLHLVKQHWSTPMEQLAISLPSACFSRKTSQNFFIVIEMPLSFTIVICLVIKSKFLFACSLKILEAPCLLFICIHYLFTLCRIVVVIVNTN